MWSRPSLSDLPPWRRPVSCRNPSPITNAPRWLRWPRSREICSSRPRSLHSAPWPITWVSATPCLSRRFSPYRRSYCTGGCFKACAGSRPDLKIKLHKGDLPNSLELGPLVAIDTETLGLVPPRDRLCLAQLSSGDGTAHMVQFAPNQYNAPNLKRLLSDSTCTKLFHFARFDVAVF